MKKTNKPDIKKRNNLKKVIFGGVTIGAGLIGLSGVANSRIIFRTNGSEKKLVSVGSSEPSNPEVGDLWVDTSDQGA